jgi:TrmH family RNA methyltransferase
MLNSKKIESKDNEKIKLLKKLKLRKYREKYNKFFVENFNIIKDAGVGFSSLFVTQEFIDDNPKELELILKKSGAREYYIINNRLNKSFSELDNPSGICAVYERGKEKVDLNSRIVYLNGINDPGNLGTILRSALAFNFNNIVLDETCADMYNAKTINAAKDSIFKLNISHDKDLRILKEIKKKMKVYATRLEGGEDIVKLKKDKKLCVVLGSEARGVSREIEKMSDKFINIKINKEIESLNVAAAASIIFYEVSKK